jgi:hypothetical protein
MPTYFAPGISGKVDERAKRPRLHACAIPRRMRFLNCPLRTGFGLLVDPTNARPPKACVRFWGYVIVVDMMENSFVGLRRCLPS